MALGVISRVQKNQIRISKEEKKELNNKQNYLQIQLKIQISEGCALLYGSGGNKPCATDFHSPSNFASAISSLCFNSFYI